MNIERVWGYEYEAKIPATVYKSRKSSPALSVSQWSLYYPMNYISQFYYSRSTQQDFYNIAETTTVSLNHQLEIYFRQIARSTYAMNAGVLRIQAYWAAGEFELDSGLAQGRFDDESGESLHDQRNA